MSDFQDFLIELGTEELPPKALRKLSESFQQGVEKGLTAAELSFGEIKAYATPRRLALVISQLQTRQPDRQVERRGPAVTAGFDADGKPTKALQGFARSCGVEVEALETMETDKGAWLVFKQLQTGHHATDLLADIIQQSLNDLPIPKRMRWGSSDVEFVRPVQWLVALLDNEVVPMTILGITADRYSRGHRFHQPEPIYIESPKHYADQLAQQGKIIPDFAVRQQVIQEQAEKLGTELGGEAIINADLLEEITGLVEWPVALAGNFDTRFLELPAEALISSMEGHQKYFAVKDKQGKLLPHFITMSNIESKDPAQVIAGNERVILPRLSDSAFFWETDRKHPLADSQDKLKNIVFQNKLGSVYDKAQRVATLAAHIANQIGANTAEAERAAMLAKCDLVSEMVGEFPDLQGIMGRYYALLDNEPNDVAEALNEQYMPRFAGDALPNTAIGQALSIAEKLDTIVGLFGIGQPPSGVKDPFALRRAALGVLRIIIEKQLDLDLAELVLFTSNNFEKGILSETDILKPVMQYFYDRLRGYLLEQDFKVDEFDSVLSITPSKPLDFVQRIKAVAAFRQLEQAASLAAANKRIANILRKNESEQALSLNDALLQEQAEQTLANTVKQARQDIEPLVKQADYAGVLTYLAGLRETVDQFFDEVMVMAEDQAVRHNRLALLKQTRELFLGVADISCLQA